MRYADDFIILVGASHKPGQWDRAEAAAHEEMVALAKMLEDELGLELSEAKTKVTKVTDPLRFLGHHVRVQRHPQYGLCSKCVVPKDRSQKLRHAIKAHFDKRTRNFSLQERLEKLNRILSGWGNFYRHVWGAKRVFAALDHYLWWAIMRWLKKKHKDARYGGSTATTAGESQAARPFVGRTATSDPSKWSGCALSVFGMRGSPHPTLRRHLRRARCITKGARRVR